MFIVFPTIFTLIDIVILIAAVYRIWANFKDDPQVIANEKMIFLHITMLIVIFLTEFVAYYFKFILGDKY